MTPAEHPDRVPPVPRATYRLQLRESFGLRDALKLVPYLSELGVSHVYASPLLKAGPHSAHGYDVCDFNQLNPELGEETDLAAFVTELHRRGMGLVLDLVPNHMGIGGPENRWWWDVLTHGQGSRYASFFDIDWNSPDPRLRGKVLVPMLEHRYDSALRRHDLQLMFENGQFVLGSQQRRWPVAPSSITALPGYASQLEKGPEGVAAAVSELNANPDALDDFIREQHYRPAFWLCGDAELNYRRFFAVATLGAVRVEEEEVFNAVHGLIGKWLRNGWVDGLRVDHVDGLRDPGQYLERLRCLAPKAWIVVEKVLLAEERMPAAWPIAGTTGYDFLNRVGGLFIDPEGERMLTDFYRDFTGESTDFPEVVREKKQLVLRGLMGADVNRLVQQLLEIAAHQWRGRDFTRDELRDALIELAACFPVYRTYVHPAETEPERIWNVAEQDAAFIEQAAQRASEERPDLTPQLFDFLKSLLLPRPDANPPRRNGTSELESDFRLRFQQLTGPAMGKGAEDTAFYCFHRLPALNEVGGDPGRFGVSVEAFHEACAEQQAHWPHTMLTTSTHDTKRSEDVRARISFLSEIPHQWRAAVARWSAMNERHRRAGWPDRNAEYLFYQTLAGAWPLSVERAVAYMAKAACEAQQHTSWKYRNGRYDAALQDFVMGALNDREFIGEMERFTALLADAGRVNSLAQTLIKLTAPGVPDIYQGCELWDLSLVDPDNRRAVDFELRQRLLAELTTLSAGEAWQRRREGLPKLWLIRRTLALRAQRPELFEGASRYEGLFARGAKAGHVVAFARGGSAITVVPRLVARLDGGSDVLDWTGHDRAQRRWGDTVLDLPDGLWRNEVTGESAGRGPASLADLLREFPVALLARKEFP